MIYSFLKKGLAERVTLISGFVLPGLYLISVGSKSEHARLLYNAVIYYVRLL